MPEGNQVQWLVASLRLTAFTTIEPDLGDLPGTWKAIVGDEPDAVESKPKEHLFQETGPFRESSLTFRHLPQRIDWILRASESTEDDWDTIGQFEDKIPPFSELMKKWLIANRAVMRLAFGAVLLDPVMNGAEGYRKISRFLPFEVDSDARNFMYQINRRRLSSQGRSGLEINRLSKWSCLERRTTHFVLGEHTTPILNADSPSLFAVRLEVDINTVPECADRVDSDNLASLFDEFVTFGREIAEKGDIR